MKRHWMIVSIILAGLIVSFGCQRSSPPALASAPPPSLQAKVNRLEQELKLVEASREEARQTIRDLELKLQKQATQIQELEKARDDLKTQLKHRTSERDAVHSHFESFRKTLKEALSQADAMYLPSASSSGSVTTPTSTPLKGSVPGALLPLKKGS